MKTAFLASVLSIFSIASVEGFIGGTTPLRTTSCPRAAPLAMSAEPMSRGDLLQKGALSIASLLAISQPASAAKYFGDDKDSYPEVVKPKDAVRDNELLTSPEVKSSIETIKKYKATVDDLRTQLSKNDQADLQKKIKTSFNFSQLRVALNEANSVFDEDTQRGTDRLIRNMIQDVIEFGDASRMKEDKPRSKRKVDILNKKLEKLERSFDDLLAFF